MEGSSAGEGPRLRKPSPEHPPVELPRPVGPLGPPPKLSVADQDGSPSNSQFPNCLGLDESKTAL